MGLAMRTVVWLRQQGHDAVHLREQGLQRMLDPDILAKARMEGRTLLSMDLGFGDLLAISGAQLPSIIIFRQKNRRPEVINALLADVIAHHEQDLQAGASISVTDPSIRVRSPPTLQDAGTILLKGYSHRTSVVPPHSEPVQHGATAHRAEDLRVGTLSHLTSFHSHQRESPMEEVSTVSHKDVQPASHQPVVRGHVHLDRPVIDLARCDDPYLPDSGSHHSHRLTALPTGHSPLA
jgi:predicted nuclease of predicted toxin-antitoxin system